MIHRSDHESNYMMINNELTRDSRLSLEARGLLVLMLSMSDDWNFSVKESDRSQAFHCHQND